MASSTASLDCLVLLLALGLVVQGQVVIVRGNQDLMSEGAAADIVDLADHIVPLVLVTLAVVGVGGQMMEEAGLVSPVLGPLVGLVPGAAEAEGFLGTVLRFRLGTDH